MHTPMQYKANEAERRQILTAEASQDDLGFLREALDGRFDLRTMPEDADTPDWISRNRNVLALVLVDPQKEKGAQLLRQIVEDPLLKQIPVIAMGRDRKAEAESLKAGALDYLYLPGMLPETALTRIRHAIEISASQNIIRSTERDQLTGLYNKDFFFSYVAQYDEYHPDMEMDALMVNINHFHMINERYGKAYGDDALRGVASRINEHLAADGGIVSRRDGDAFMVYRPHRENYAKLLADATEGLNSRIRLRMGVYPKVDKTLEIERRFDRAKLACDRVRNSFSQAVAIYDDRLRQSEIYIEQLMEDFPAAIAEGQFVVYYQPKFEIQSTMPKLHSAEALVRWNHPRLGQINPGQFVPLFESNGLIRRLDSYVWRQVAAQMRDWKDRLDFCLPVSVNVSRVDMFDQDLVEHMCALMKEFGLHPDEFLLEITESAYTQDSARIIETVNELRRRGFHIEIDDFGSGYSSLSMISTLPMDALKLDMEFMHNAFRERKNTKMLDAVIDIAYSLEVPTIAEGVETAEQMFALKEMGCDIVQGYYFSGPMPAEEYELYLIERKNGLDGVPSRQARESIVKPADQFAYEALHDPLTQLYNHSAYKMLLKDADQRNIALLLVDLEGYDELVQAQGSEIADRAVCLVAEVLKHNFRSVDFVCRIEADEFAIIMTRVSSEMRQLISDKVARINQMLEEKREDLPPLRLCIGVAFADRENPSGDIFHDADLALASIRELPNDNWRIY